MKTCRPLPLLALALLPGCSVLPRPVPLEIYQLPPVAARAAAATAALPWSLRVTRPASSGLLAGQRLLVSPADNRIAYYKGAQWSEPAALLLRNRLLDALRADGRLAAVSGDERLLHADFELDSELRAFQSEYLDGVPHARLRLDVRLVRVAGQRILASQRFDISAPASGSAVPEVVQAFGVVSDRLARELSDWAIAQIAVAQAGAR